MTIGGSLKFDKLVLRYSILLSLPDFLLIKDNRHNGTIFSSNRYHNRCFHKSTHTTKINRQCNIDSPLQETSLTKNTIVL